jgi:hypothetical protein
MRGTFAQYRSIFLFLVARGNREVQWVIDAVRATLSSEGLTFASSALLTRFLEQDDPGDRARPEAIPEHGGAAVGRHLLPCLPLHGDRQRSR